jgi:hypothetical protein
MADAFRRAQHIAERLAPAPIARPELFHETEQAAVWERHYAALALAAHAALREESRTLPANPEPGSRPDLGYLSFIATSATAAVIALIYPGTAVYKLWDLTPELGALNGEYVDFLADLLDNHGINPADIYPDFEAGDFQSIARFAPPAAAVESEPTPTVVQDRIEESA